MIGLGQDVGERPEDRAVVSGADPLKVFGVSALALDDLSGSVGVQGQKQAGLVGVDPVDADVEECFLIRFFRVFEVMTSLLKL